MADQYHCLKLCTLKTTQLEDCCKRDRLSSPFELRQPAGLQQLLRRVGHVMRGRPRLRKVAADEHVVGLSRKAVLALELPVQLVVQQALPLAQLVIVGVERRVVPAAIMKLFHAESTGRG